MTISLTHNQAGAKEVGKAALGLANNGSYLTLHLYVNDAFPAWSDDGSELVECTNAGYAAVTPNWAASVETDPGDRWQWAAPSVTLTFAAYAGPLVTIYGGFSKNSAGVVCMFGRNSAPFTIPLAGGTFTVRPVYQSIAAAP